MAEVWHGGGTGITPHELDMMRWAPEVKRVAKAMCWTSVACGAAAVLSYALFPDKRRFPARLPAYFCLAVLGVVASSLVGLYDPVGGCRYQALGMTFFGNAGVMWWMLISVNTYLVVCRDARMSSWRERSYLLLGWGEPLVVTAAAHFSGVLDTRPVPWRWECWVSPLHSYDQWLLFYGEMGLAIILGLVLWPQVAQRIWQAHRGEMPGREVVLQHVRHLMFIVIFVTVFAVMFAYRLTEDYGRPSYVLTLGHTCAVTGTGIYVFVIFAASSDNARRWWRLLTRCDSGRPPVISASRARLLGDTNGARDEPLIYPRGGYADEPVVVY